MERDEIYRIVVLKYEDYADRVVVQIKALPKDCRQSRDDSVLEDVWEEFKYQVQRQESVLFEVYGDTIARICQDLVEDLPAQEQDLLWLVSDAYFNYDEENGLPAKNQVTEDIATELYNRVCSKAADEDLKNDPDVTSEEE